MHRDSRLLKAKALSSLRRAAQAFNSFEEDGRVTSVLLHLQHAFEMLLKAALREKGVRVFDRKNGRSLSFEKCVNLAAEKLRPKPDQLGLLRAIDALRDDEQHYLGEPTEGLLYLHVRAAVTLFDEFLEDAFGEKLAEHLPTRVLPISTDPPQDLDVLIDEQFAQIKKLLEPGRRRRAEARAQIRALLAMEGHVAEQVLVTEKDVNRVERAIKSKKNRKEVFPRLEGLAATVDGTGVTVTVHFTKKEGVPVRFVPADDPTQAAAVRELDLQKKYRYSARELADHVELTLPKSYALRQYLKLDADTTCRHEFVFDSQRIPRYSDAAIQKMRTAKATVDMDEIWQQHRPRRKARAGT